VTDDLVKRLRAKWCGYHGLDESHFVNPDGPEAADRIEALNAEVARLRGLFASLAIDADACAVSRQYARAALGDEA
jgi:hypothetical protein